MNTKISSEIKLLKPQWHKIQNRYLEFITGHQSQKLTYCIS